MLMALLVLLYKQMNVASCRGRLSPAPYVSVWTRKEILDLFDLWGEKAVGESQEQEYEDISRGGKPRAIKGKRSKVGPATWQG